MDDRPEPTQRTAGITPTEQLWTLSPVELLPAGTMVGRYRIVRLLSIGGMGVVFKAHDPKLSRDIALKLVQPTFVDDVTPLTAEDYEQRLLREAQALARLSHPNVVAAFDVGRYGGALFIAMELIEGESLRTWLLSEPRARREVLQILLEAGRGLAAAHRAGVVHRDFKLSNVMVSARGRVQVVDFGLARTTGIVLEPGPSESSQQGSPTADRAGLHSGEFTRTGTVIGTPGYIAPEQFDGGASDERSDQFGYAASAFRALTGQSPYAFESLIDYRTALLAGARAPWPKSVPRAIRKVIDRGLARSPAARYPTLDALLEDLERAARPPRRLQLLTVAALGMSSLVSVLAMRDRWVPRCELNPLLLEHAWNSERSGRVEAAFVRSGSTRAADSFSAVRAKVDAFRERWQAARQEACLATYERREQTEQTLSLRNACLDDELRQFGILVELFEGADARMVDGAPQAVDELTSVARCSDISSLVGESDRLPNEPERRQAVVALQRQFDTLEAMSATGSWSALLEKGEALARSAQQAGYTPIEARAMSHTVNALERLGRPQESSALRERTLQIASDAKVHDVLAQQATRVLREHVDAGRIPEGKALLPFVDMALGLAGRPPELQIRVRSYQAAILTAESNYPAAIELLQRALAECRQLGSGSARSCLAPQRELGLVYAESHDKEGARRELRAAVELAKQAYGARHSNVLNEYNNMTEMMLHARDLDTASTLIAESKILAASLPADRPSAKLPMLEGRLLAMRGDCRAAMPLLEEGSRRIAAVFGERTMQASTGTYELGKCLLELGETDAAISRFEHTLELLRAVRAEPSRIAFALFRLAEALWKKPEQHRRARQLAEEALGLFQSDGAKSLEDSRMVGEWLSSHPRAPLVAKMEKR